MPGACHVDNRSVIGKRARFYVGLAAGCIVALAVLAAVLVIKKNRASADELTPEERQLAVLTNAARIRERLPDLKSDPALCRVARAHAQLMAGQKRLHFPDDEDLRKQLERAGYPCIACWMIIDVLGALDLPTAFDEAMRHDDTRLEVLNDHYGQIGVSIVQDDEGFFYLVQLLGERR